MMQESIGELVYYTVGYMQMTEEQVKLLQCWFSKGVCVILSLCV
jgi:hypothetical protein